MKIHLVLLYPGGEPQTWKITRNVIWDPHRPENQANCRHRNNHGYSQSWSAIQYCFATMRIFTPLYNSGNLKTPGGQNALDLCARNNATIVQILIMDGR